MTEMMADKASLWDHIVDQHGLRRIPYDQIVSWGYGDFVFGAGFDIISSMAKARRYGFGEAVDTEEMFFRMRDAGVLLSISGIPGRSREGNRVAHIGEARDVSDGALEAEAKTRVWHRTVTA